MQQDDKIITFDSYHDPMLAHILRAKLDANNIPCFIEDDHMAGLNALYSQSTGIKLMIFERDYEKCKAILAEDNETTTEPLAIDPETEDIIVCPYCASSNVNRILPNDSRPDWVNTLYAFFANIFPFYTSNQWHCVNCKQDFE